MRTGTKVRANSASGSGDFFCTSLQKGQKMLAGETTVSHASVRHSDTELRGSRTLPVNSQQSGRHSPGRQAGSIWACSHAAHPLSLRFPAFSARGAGSSESADTVLMSAP